MRFLLVIILITSPAVGLAVEPSLMPYVVEGIEQTIQRGEARGIAVGLYDNGQTRVIGFGSISRTDEQAPRGDTVFEIGSISKVFTSLLTQVQVEEGKLDWDNTLAERLPGTEYVDAQVAAITLRELATHSSGLPRLPDDMNPADPLNPYLGYGREQLLLFLAGFDPDQLVKTYAYSNLAVGLLGVIAGDAAGSDYGDAMTRVVLQPLGMKDTGTVLQNGQAGRLAQGFSAGADMPNWDGFDALAGAGALLSTTDDMLYFVHQNLEPGNLGKSLAAIRVPQGDGKTAFGWHIQNKSGGGSVYWHNGGTGGYASFLAINPETGTGVVILATTTEYNAITELGFAQVNGKSANAVMVDLGKYPGSYQIAEGFVLSIFIERDQLFAQATGQAAFGLTPSAENEFVFPAGDIRIVFDIADATRAESLTLYQGGQVTPAPRVTDDRGPQTRQEITLTEEELNDFVGEFQLAPGVLISIIVRGQQLFAQLTNQSAFPVFAYEKDRFFFKVVDAQLHFERDDKGSVIAVVLHQGGEQRAQRIN